MVKTTLEIEDEVYRKLVEASVRKYGNARNISKMATEVIRAHLKEKPMSEITRAKEEDTDKKPDIVERTFGIWKTKETGDEYVRRIRKGWRKRAKRLGI